MRCEFDEELVLENELLTGAFAHPFIHSMGDMIWRTSVFLQDVKEVLRKRSDERAKCPRCRGSGLLNLLSSWKQDRPSQRNAPCLFCEGVGVMPIVGLRGYIIGRTDAMLTTKEIKKRPVVPDNIQFPYPGKLPGRNSTRFSSRRSFKTSPLLLYNPLSSPDWLREAEIEASLIRSSQMETRAQSLDHRDCDDMSPVGLIGLDQAGWRYRHRFYARTSAPFTDPKASRPSDISNETHKVEEGRAAEGSELEGVSRDAHQSVDAGSFRHVDSDLQEKSFGVSVASSPRGHRSSRRARNRIREKAGKEATARARKVQTPLTPPCEAPPETWNPLLRMCRYLLLRRASAPSKC